MVAFLLLFVSIFFISVSTYWQVFVASGVIGLVMGLPTLILSQILWCYNTATTNKTKCVMMVYGGFTLLTSLCCFIIGLFLLLYPECNYNYYMDCSGSGSDYDDDYHDHNRWLQNYQEHHERRLAHTLPPWKPYGIMMIVDSVLWCVSALCIFHFLVNRYEHDSANKNNENNDGENKIERVRRKCGCL